jgi:hypothetical protein
LAETRNEPLKFAAIVKKSGPIILIMLVVFLISFGAGFLAGKLHWADAGKMRTSKLAEFNRNLEYRVPGYGPLLRTYKTWEREKLMRHIFEGKAVKAMFLVFFNNWIVANLTMVVRTVFVLPLILYPHGRFLQGLAFAQTPVNYQFAATLVFEFGGYFLVICGTLCALLWTVFFKKFGFASRSQGFRSGLKMFAVLYIASAFFIMFGSYVEVMAILGMSIR